MKTVKQKTVFTGMLCGLLAGAGLMMSSLAMAEPAKTLADLVAEVKAEAAREYQIDKAREMKFKTSYNEQLSLLKEAKSVLAATERQRDALRLEFDENEKTLGELQEQLDRRTGDLGELFGVFRQVAGDTQSMLYDSLVSINHPDRKQTITALASSKSVPSIKEIESLWAILLDEIVASGEVVKFSSAVVKPSGEQYETDVVRVGAFNLITDGTYLRFNPSDNKIVELSRQPGSYETSSASKLFEAPSGTSAGFALDPSRGVLLSLLVQAPDLLERIEQGKLVGYAILAVGLIGMVIVLFRFMVLTRIGARIKRQKANMDQFSEDNPLGRVLSAFYSNRELSADVISKKLDEVIFKDASEFRKGINIIKVLAAIAPLMGLLGTVTGMIGTFQAITLFGTGDPKLMAGGISQALVTTVEGLVASIPLLLSHAYLSGKATDLTKLLGEQAAGMVAEQAEKLELAKRG